MGTLHAYQRYTFGLTVIGVLVAVVAGLGTTTFLPLFVFAPMLVSYVAMQMFQIVLPVGFGITFASAVALAAVAWMGPGPAVVLVACGGVVTGLVLRAPLDRLCVNSSVFVLSNALAGLAFKLAGGALGESFLVNPVPLLAAMAVHRVADMALVTTTVAVYKGRPLWVSFKDIGRLASLCMAATDLVSVPLVLAISAWGILPALLPITGAAVAASFALDRLAKRAHRRLLGELISSAGGVAPAGLPVDVSSELTRLVSALAEASGLGPEESDALRWAALLHDSGLTESAIGVSCSSEALSEEQLRRIREHPLRAAMRVGQVGSLLRVARILETHHEHHNGWGYPFGLKGDEITLPAALLGLAEAYLALTVLRSHRQKVLAPEEALRNIQSRAGEQFSPAAVQALEKCVATGALQVGEEGASRQSVATAVDRLYRLAGTPKLPLHLSVTGSGGDLWFRTGGPQRFMRRLFARDPLRLGRREKELATEWYQSLFDLGRTFSSSLTVQVIARQLAEAVHGLTTLPTVVHLVADDGETLLPAAVCGLPEEAVRGLRLSANKGLIGLAVTERRPVTSLNVAEDPRAMYQEKARVLGLKSLLCVPLRAADTPLGGISVNSPTVRRFPPSEVRALSVMADLAALALHNAFLYRKANSRLDQLGEAQAYLNAIFDTVPTGVLTLAADGRLMACNRQASRHLFDLGVVDRLRGDLAAGMDRAPWPGGHTLAERVSTPGEPDPAANPRPRVDGPFGVGPEPGEPATGTANLIEALHAKLGAEVLRQALETRRPCGPETVSAALPAGERFFKVWASPLYDSTGAASGLLVVLDDVTEAKSLAAEVHRTEKLAAVGEVAAKAAHEIKNPLASIRGFTQLMGLYCPVRNQWRECPRYVDHIAGEVDRLSEIAQSMLALARPARPLVAPGDLSAVVAETLDFLAGQASERGITIERAERPTGVTAEFDAGQVKQVVLNLVQNALDALAGPGGPPPGWRKVTVSVGHTRREGRRYVFIQVGDNGPGIQADDRAKVFTPFFTTKETGTGLGLPISKSIVEAHGGSIEVRSAPGRGCVFEVLLPALARPKSNGAASVEGRPPALTRPGNGTPAGLPG